MSRLVTRRDFLKTLVAGGVAVAGGGCVRVREVYPVGRTSDQSLRLVFFTDVHARPDWEIPAALAKAAAAINAEKPDLVIGGGDFIEGGLRSSAASMKPRWDVYMEMHRAIDAEVRTAIGNHDLVAALPADGSPPAADPRAVYRRRLGLDGTYYAFDAGGYHFLILDSVAVVGGEPGYEGRIDAEQLEWIRADLARISPATPIVVVLHVPLLTVFDSATEGAAGAPSPSRIVVNNHEVLRLFRDRNLVLVLQGHLHVTESIRWGGATFLTGGAVCAKWWRGAWYGTGEGFCSITLRGDRVDWRYVDYGWEPRRPKNA